MDTNTTPEKKYVVTLPKYGEIEVWDSGRYERNKDDLFEQYPDAEVAELSAYDGNVTDNEQFVVSLPDYDDEVEVWDGGRLKRNYDDLIKQYPNAQISRVKKKVDYYGDQLRDLEQQRAVLKQQRDELKAQNKERDKDAAEQEVGNEAQIRENLNQLDVLDREIDDLNKRIFNNPAYQREHMAKIQLFGDEAKRMDSLAAELEASNPDARKMQNEIGKLNKGFVRSALDEGTTAGLQGSAKVLDRKDNPEYYRDLDALFAAKLLYEDALKTESAPSRYDDTKTGIGNFFRGAIGEAPETLSPIALAKAFGEGAPIIKAVKQIQDAEGKNANIVDLIVNHPEEMNYLSSAQKELIKAFVIKSATDWARSEDMSLGYQSGSTAMQSVGFMMDFLTMGGAGEAVASAATKGLTKVIAKKSVDMGLKGAKRELVQAPAKFLEGTVKSIVKTAVMTPAMASSYSNLLTNLATLDPETGGVDLSGGAIINAIGDVFIDNFSESAGTQVEGILGFLPEMAGKGISKTNFGKWIAGTEFGKLGKAFTNSQASKLLRQAGWNGYIGEIGEEWYGNLLRVMTGVDKDALRDFATVDQQIITLTSFAPMSIFGGGVSAAQYGLAKKRLASKGKALAAALSKSGYEQDQIEAILDITKATNPTQLAEQLAPVVNQVALDNLPTSTEVYKAVMDYADAVARYRTFDGAYQGRAQQLRQEKLDELNQQAGQSIVRERQVAQPDGSTMKLESVRTIDMAGIGSAYVMGENDGDLALMDRDGKKFFLSKESLQRMIESGQAVDNGDVRLDDFLDAEIAARKRQDETVRVAREMNTQLADVHARIEQERKLNIGTVENPIWAPVISMDSDGVVVENPDSEQGFDTYTWEQVAEKLGQPINVQTDEQKEEQAVLELENKKRIREGMRNVPAGTKLHYNVEQPDGSVKPLEVEYTGQTLLDDEGNLMIGIKNGAVEGLQRAENFNSDELEALIAGAGTQQTGQAADSTAETSAQGEQQPEGAEPAQPAEGAAEEQPQAPEEPQQPAVVDYKGNPLPTKTVNGEIVVDEASLWNKDAKAWALWNDEKRQDNGENSVKYIGTVIKQLEGSIKKTTKAYEKETNFDKRAKLEEMIAADTQRLGELQGLLAEYAQAAEQRNAEAQAAAAEKNRLEMEEARRKLEESRKGKVEDLAKHNTESLQEIKKKWDEAPKETGFENEIVLTDGSTVKGRYVLTEAFAPTPSHDARNGYQMTKGFPVDANGRTVNDRDYEHDKAAQRQVEQKAQSYDQRAIQTPVVVSSDGIVLSGNDRTMASQLAATNGTDTKYTDYLKSHAQMYGFTTDQVEGFANPRVVFVPDEAMPYTTDTFARFNGRETKSQSRTEKAVKAGKTIDANTIDLIARIIDGFDSIAEAYADESAVARIVSTLVAAGVIQENEVEEMMDGKQLSGTGKDRVETIMLGAVLREDALRCAMQDGAVRRSIMSALMQLLGNNTLGSDYSLIDEFNDAIVLLYQAKASKLVKIGESMANYMTQPVLEGFGESPVYSATIQMIANVINGTKLNGLKNLLSLYNTRAAEAASGQMDMFLGDVESKESIVKSILEKYGYNTETYNAESGEQSAAGAESGAEEESGSAEEQDDSSLRSDAGNGEEEVEQQPAETPQEPESIDRQIEHLEEIKDNPGADKKLVRAEIDRLKAEQKEEAPAASEPEQGGLFDNQPEEEPAQEEAPAAEPTKTPLGTIRTGKHTKTGEDLWIVTPAGRASKEEFAKLKASAKEHNGYYSSFKPNNGFLFKSEEDAQAFNNENAREADEPISHEELSSVVGGTFDTIKPEVKEEAKQEDKAAESEKEPEARWEYHIYVNEDSGLCSISRDDVSGPIPIGDSRFRITAESPVELKAILEHNGMDAILKEVGSTLDLRIDEWNIRQKAKTEGFHGYKIGDKVFYNPDGSEEYSGTVIGFEEYGDHLPLLDTGQAPVMSVVAHLNQIRHAAEGELEPKKTPAETPKAQANPSGNKLVTDERYAELKRRMMAKLKGQMNIGIDPEILAIGTEMAVYHIEKGARKFVDYAKAMVTELGDLIRPYLKAFYNGARDLPEMADLAKEMTPYDEVSAVDTANFDKEPEQVDLFTFVDTATKEKEAEQQAEEAKRKIKTAVRPSESEKKSVSSQKQQSNNKDNELPGRSPAQNGSVGEGEQPADEQSLRGGVAGRSDGDSSSDKGRSGSVASVPAQRTVKKNRNNNHVERGESYVPATNKQRIDANIQAIQKMRELTTSGKEATAEDMAILRQYSGWGGLGSVFNNEYSKEYRQLKDLLTDDEFQDAVMSVNSAYYTPVNVIDAMWDAAKSLGFAGGQVLEGSAGTGNIIASMPRKMSEASDITAVEIDSVTGNILKLLYPDADVHINGFEETNIPNNSVDLAITNVPFVTGLHVYDKVEKDLSRKFGDIHDFCIAKNVRKLKEGGIGIFITSKGTLDKSKALRNWVVNEGNADFIGAFRLNNGTFVGTSVTSDIIIIRKRVNNQKSPNAIDVSGTTVVRKSVYVPDKYGEKDKPVVMEYNSYFAEHPENMGGEMKFRFEKGDTYRPTGTDLYPKDGTDQDGVLAKWVKSLRNDGEKAKAETKTEQQTEHEKTDNVKEGQIIVNSKGEVCVSRSGKAVPLGVNANKVKGESKATVIKDYNTIKSALNAVLDYQTANESDEGLKPLLKALNNAYDGFVKKYGALHKNTAISFLREDVDFAAISAIEGYKEVETIDGKKAIQTMKSDVFSRRVVGYKTEPTPKNTREGIIVSVNQFGRIDLDYISGKIGLPVETIRQEAIGNGLGFENPQTGELEVSYEYLSGNVREKLDYARSHNEDGRYDANIKALEKVIPLDIPAHLIEFTLGSDWLGTKLYVDFAREKYGVDDSFKVSNVGGRWAITDNYFGGHNEKNRAAGVTSSVLRTTCFGHQLMLAAMNNEQIIFSKTTKDRYTGETTTVKDEAASQAATERMAEIREEFKEWCRDKMLKDTELAQQVQKTYNDLFNAIVPKEIGDEFLPSHFEGSNIAINLYPHQAKAVIRGTTEPLMLAHEVGSGKTFTLITTAMEMRRLGTAKKPMIVVQNATVGQFVTEAKKLYPNAKVLTLSDKDHTREGRTAFYAKIKYNDWDMIIVPQSVFEMIPDSEVRQRAFVQDKIDEQKHIIEQAREAKLESAKIKQMERGLEALEKEYESVASVTKDAKKEAAAMENAAAKARLQLDRKVDEVANFDDMDIDALLIDEAHEYKHLGFVTSIKRGVKGVDPSYSKKSAGVFLKTRAVFDKVGWKNVVFATGTPISNTAAEIWTFMKYLMPADQMRQNHIYYFDDFVRNFGKIAQSLEWSTNGRYKENTRFSAYVNLPELVRIWSSVSDTVLSKDAEVANGQKLSEKLPEMQGGKAQDIFLSQSPSLVGILRKVNATLDAYEKLSGKEKRENSHIPLTMYGIAKRAAIDPRLVDANAADEPLSKTNKAVEEILKDLEATKDYKGTVAVFCDNYRRLEPDEKGKKREGFNLFNEVKRKLIEAGVPESQIVIMQSGMSAAKKEKIFSQVNEGEVRVILGSTQTLGTGVNIQRRLHLLIHMDAPDRPMDYTQRNGRILRQGNLHKEWGKSVRVLRFGVEDSLDVTSYQRLKTKAAFIDSVMDGKPLIANSMENRVLEEEEEGLFDNPVAVLSGSQYALLKQQAERELRKYQNALSQYQQDQIYIERQMRDNSSRIGRYTDQIADYKESAKKVQETFAGGKVKNIVVEGISCRTGEEIEKAIKEKITNPLNIAKTAARTSYGWNATDYHFTLTLDGVKVLVTVNVARKEATYMDAASSKPSSLTTIQYQIPDLFKDNKFYISPREGISGIIDTFKKEFATGEYQKKAIEKRESDIKQLEVDNAQMQKRRGVPFKDEDKLAAARARAAEYAKLMKEEMDEKQKKYAEMQAAETGIDVNNIEVEDEDSEGGELQIADEELRIENDEQQLAFDTVSQMLSDAGIEVEQLSDEAMTQMAERMEEKEKALEIVSSQNGYQQTVISSASGAKILKNVVFNDSDLKIIDRIEFLRDGDVVYGAAVGGKIYLNADKLNPNTPIHEYTHLWDKACRKTNPELWKRGVELMKQTSVWNEVASDPNYSHLDEDGIASEVHSRLSGKNGAQTLERFSSEAIEGNGSILDKAARASVISKLRKWLSEFWYWVKDTFTQWSSAEARNVSLEDFINMPLADLARRTRVTEILAQANAGQKQPGGEYADVSEMELPQFAISKNNRRTIEGWLDKWAEAQTGRDAQMMKRVALDYLDDLDDATTQLAWAKWFCAGKVRLGDEDMPKVEQAIAIAKKHKLDPMTFESPMAIINQFPNEGIKEKRINPDTVPTLHRAKEFADKGLVIYDVDDTQESRENMRRIINTHFGKDCSPWCLLQGDGEGNLTTGSAKYWRHYSAYPKQVVFRNGKLLAFSANNNRERVWWDRMDDSHKGIPITEKIPDDELGRTGTISFDPETGETIGEYYGVHKGNKQNGTYEWWAEYAGAERYGIAHYKDGKKEGVEENYYRLPGKDWTIKNVRLYKADSMNVEDKYDKGRIIAHRVSDYKTVSGTHYSADYNATYFYTENGKRITDEQATFGSSVADGARAKIMGAGSVFTYEAESPGGGIDFFYTEIDDDRRLRLTIPLIENQDGLRVIWDNDGHRFADGFIYSNARWFDEEVPAELLQKAFSEYNIPGEPTMDNIIEYFKGKTVETIQKGRDLDAEYKKKYGSLSAKSTMRFRSAEDVTEEQAIINKAKADGTYMKAPNGKRSKLNERQWAQVRTAAFKKWFGDWENEPENASKVVDENGEPMVVYHGSRTPGFTTFEPSVRNEQGSGIPMWLSTKNWYAHEYSDAWTDSQREYFGKEQQEIFELGEASGLTEDGTYSLFANIRNPYNAGDINAYTNSDTFRKIASDFGMTPKELEKLCEKSRTDNVGYIWEITNTPEFAELVRKSGYDGIEAIEHDVRTFAFFNSNQVKSATNNNGDFSTENNDIRYRTSEQLTEEYGSRWLDEQTNEDGRHTTQVANTISSYRKFGDWVKTDSEGREVSVLDASSGLGLGTEWMRENGIDADDVEPYPSENRIPPTYQSYDDIDKRYDYIISNAVLNVIPDDWRADVLHNMADKLKVGGKLVINVRGAKSIENQGTEGKTKTSLDSPSEILVTRPDGSIRAYQKGFTKQELKEWCESELGEDYNVEIANKNNAGDSYETAVVVTKQREDTHAREREARLNDPTDRSESLAGWREVAERTAQILGVPVEIVTRNDMPQGHKNSLGVWQDGKIRICLENHPNSSEVQRTVLHEVVGHNGLRRLVGDENMDAFCMEVFRNASEDIRGQIAALAAKHGYDFAEATEEFLAMQTEEMDFSNKWSEFWTNVRHALMTLLRKLGLADMTLNTKDVQWLMWQSYNANKRSDLLNQAKRAYVSHRLGFSDVDNEARIQVQSAIRDRVVERVALKSAAAAYNNAVNFVRNRMTETWTDMYQSVNDLVEAIEINSGKTARGFEDVRLALNQQSSKGLAAIQKWTREHFEPMMEAVKGLMKDCNLSLKEMERYVMLKHGLERNEVFAARDAREYYQNVFDQAVQRINAREDWDDAVKKAAIGREEAKLEKHFEDIDNGTDKKYQEYREKDYGGLTALFTEQGAVDRKDYDSEEEYLQAVKDARRQLYEDVAGMEEAAMAEVAAYEERFGRTATDDLWEKINGATKSILKHQYDANMLTPEAYDHVRTMFKYYVPLRGFADTEAEDLYSYYTQETRGTGYTSPLLSAHGRTTEAESPFGYIGAMANSAIVSDVKNETKMALYFFIRNRRASASDILTISETWYEAVDEGEFRPAYFPYTEGLDTDEAKAAYDRWEETMKEKARHGLAFRGSDRFKLGYVVHIAPSSAPEHAINLRVRGKELTIYLNGNPRAARAINGELNVERSADYQMIFGRLLRYFSAINTSWNPEFWISNMQRDILFSLMAVSAKEDSEYNREYHKNLLRMLSTIVPGTKSGVHSLKKALENGTLGDSRYEQYYRDFVEHGGVTGYVVTFDNERWEEEAKKFTGEKAAVVTALGKVGSAISGFGESIEQMTRFAAFVTSREMGRDLKESVRDAKELTVNFNRKGSGKAISFEDAKKLTDKNGKPLNWAEQAGAVMWSWIPVYGRRAVMFFNASMQGLNAVAKLFKAKPGKTMLWAAGYFAMGLINAILHSMMDDDDDYLDIPDYERRNNALLGGNGVYFKWALPQEARAFYAFGDIVYNHIAGRTPNKHAVPEMLESLLESTAPLNPAGGVSAIAPSAAVPFVEAGLPFGIMWEGTNRDYKGSRIWNDMKYLSDEEKKRTPNYQKAFDGTGKLYIDFAKLMNNISGGDYADAGAINLNPARMEHYLEGFGGGILTTINKTLKSTVGQLWGEDLQVRTTPFLSRLLTIPDERYRNAHTTELFNWYKSEAEHFKTKYNAYRKAGDVDKIEKLLDSKDYDIYSTYQNYKGVMQYYNDQLKITEDKDERKELMREQDEYRKEMIKDISGK